MEKEAARAFIGGSRTVAPDGGSPRAAREARSRMNQGPLHAYRLLCKNGQVREPHAQNNESTKGGLADGFASFKIEMGAVRVVAAEQCQLPAARDQLLLNASSSLYSVNLQCRKRAKER